MHADEIPFLNAICQSPRDDVPRLIYADWLEERGDARGEFLRLEVELSHPKSKRKRRELERKCYTEFRTMDSWWRHLITNIRYKHQDVVQEFFGLDNGEGLLEVFGGKGESALLLNGKPVAFNWNGDANSHSQFLVVTVREDFQQLVPQMKELTSGNLDGRQALVEQIRLILSVFGSGLYSIVLTPPQALNDWAQVVVNKDMQNYLPFPRNLICTQPYALLVWDNAYRKGNQFANIQRQIVVTTSVMYPLCEFVIAGHETLQWRMGPLDILRIERCHSPQISLEMGIGLLPDGHPGIAEYRRMKEEQLSSLDDAVPEGTYAWQP